MAHGLKLGKDCIHFASKLLEDALRGWGLSAAQDARDCARLLEAPSPLVLVMVFIPPWWWCQRREACVALWAVLTRLISPTALVKLVLPAVLARPVTPPLARAMVFPSSSTYSLSSAIAPVIALGASADTPISHSSELLAFVGVVALGASANTPISHSRGTCSTGCPWMTPADPCLTWYLAQ